jgi:RNA polymerase sigma factor (sigma-70 family)
MDALRLLFKKLRRLLESRGRGADDIDDLMQEAFLRLQTYCRDHTVDNTEAFLVRTVLNLSAQQGRDDRRRRAVQDESEILCMVDPRPSPDAVYAGQQRLLRMKSGLERLSARTREAFLMHRIDGMSYVQIADHLGISVSMVEKHIARASFFLRDWMARGPS